MSNYIMNPSHLFCYGESHFVFIVGNLRVYECDSETYDFLKELTDTYKEGDVLPLEDELADTLLESGLVSQIKAAETESEVSSDAAKEDNTDRTNDNSEEVRDDKPFVRITNIVLELSNDCNLNCIYCYGDGGSYGRKRELMSAETARKAVDMLFNNCGDLKEPHVTFFGGEPLLNFGVLKETVAYCRELEANSDKHFTFSMTTNGTICNDEIEEFCLKNRVHVMLSIDGPKCVQDKQRPSCDGKSSFDKIVPNIERFKRINRGHLTARSTVCNPNYDFVGIKSSLLALGFTEVQMSLVDTDKSSPLYAGSKSKDTYNEPLVKEYERLALDYIETVKKEGKSSNKLFDSIIRDLYFKNIRFTACGAGMRGFAIGTDEKIYPCHRYMGMDDYAVGTLDTGIDFESTLLYRHSNVMEKEGCKECWAKFLCGGGCSHISVTQENDVRKAPQLYCETYRKLYEIAIFTYSQLKKWNEDVFRNMLEKAEDLPVVK